MPIIMDKSNIDITDSTWTSFYKISGVGTMVMMVLFLFAVICWSALGPYPSTAEGWFTLLQENRVVGFLLLSFATFYGMILYYLTFLGLYNILRNGLLPIGHLPRIPVVRVSVGSQKYFKEGGYKEITGKLYNIIKKELKPVK